MKYNFNKIINRAGTHSLKWDFCEKFTGEKDILPMWVADMDFEAPKPVVEAIRKWTEHGIFGYTERSDPYYDAVIQWMKKRHDWEIQKEWITCTPGVVPSINIAVQAFSQPGDKVILQPPVYYPFMSAVLNNGRRVVNNNLKIEEGRFLIDYEALKNSIDEKTRMIILCSPHNPVSRVWTKDELETLAKICLEHDIIMVSDEVHSDLVMKQYRHTPLATLSEEVEKAVVTCTAPNKTFNLAGLQMANIIIPNRTLYNQFKNTVAKAGLEMANMFGIVATEAAYKHGEEWLEQLLKYLQQNYNFLVSFIEENIPQVKVFPLEGTYLVWLDFRTYGLSDEKMKELLRKKAKVWLSEGYIFGEGGEGFQRMNIACPRKLLEEGLTRIAKALNSL